MDFVVTSFQVGDKENLRRGTARKRLMLMDIPGVTEFPLRKRG